MNPKVILLTGGRTGIGLEIARQLAAKGMRVYSASRQLCVPLKSADGTGEIIPVQMDVNSQEQITAALESILRESGRLDAVICNAGNGIAGAIEDTSMDEVRYQMETNFFGAVRTIQACLPIFREQRFGKILAVSSVAAITPIPYQAFYSAGKSALSIFMQSLALEVTSFGIQCCTILPGDTKTDFTSARKYTEASQKTISPYQKSMRKAVGKMEKDEAAGMEASFVASKIVNQILKEKMNPVVIPGLQYKFICWLFNLLPIKLQLFAIKTTYL